MFLDIHTCNKNILHFGLSLSLNIKEPPLKQVKNSGTKTCHISLLFADIQ